MKLAIRFIFLNVTKLQKYFPAVYIVGMNFFFFRNKPFSKAPAILARANATKIGALKPKWQLVWVQEISR